MLDRTIFRANILLVVYNNGKKPMTVQAFALIFNAPIVTVQSVRTNYADNGLEATVEHKKRITPPIPVKVNGEGEVRIIALACNIPPDGYARWALRILAVRSIVLGYVNSISHMQVGRILKNEYKPQLKKCWCIPEEHSVAFVAAMEDVIEVYSRL